MIQSTYSPRTEVTGTAIGDKISVVVTCEGKVKRIQIDPALIQSEGLEMALDGVAAATNSALEAADKLVESEIAKVTGGIKLPGMSA